MTATNEMPTKNHITEHTGVEILPPNTLLYLYFVYLLAYLSSNHEKAINVLYELAWESLSICLPHQDGELR